MILGVSEWAWIGLCYTERSVFPTASVVAAVDYVVDL